MSEQSVLMRLQCLCLEPHALTYPPSYTSERDHFEILKHTAKGVGRIISRGANGKNKTKNSTIKLPSALSVLCMKIQEDTALPLPTPIL